MSSFVAALHAMDRQADLQPYPEAKQGVRDHDQHEEGAKREDQLPLHCQGRNVRQRLV